MTWFEYEDRVGAGWRVALLGGVPNEGVISESLLKLHPEANDLDPTPENISDLATVARNAYHRRCKRGGGKTASYCDFFVFQRLVDNPDENANDRYLLQIENGCEHYKECLQNSARAVGMDGDHEAVKGADSYPLWIPQLAEDVLTPYVAPCRVVAKTIREHGFKCAEE